METTLIVAGIAFIGAAIAGGGLVAFKIEVPLIDSVARQLLLAAFGAVLLVVGVLPRFGDSQDSQPTSASTTSAPATTASSSQPEATVPSDSTVASDEMVFTTYFWSDGWIEHASWASPLSLPGLRPVIVAFNWSPDFPAFSVRLDDLMISGTATNEFDDGFIPPSWQPYATAGATAEESEGMLVITVPAGRSPEGTESRVDLNPPVYFNDEFDISISFSVDDDFYQKASGGFGLFVGDGDAIIWIVGGRYSSEQCLDDPSCTILASTEASQIEGRLRIKRSRVDH